MLLANFLNSLLEALYRVCGKEDGMGTDSCIFKALTINVSHPFVNIHRWQKNLNEGILAGHKEKFSFLKMVPCDSVVNNEFSLFLSFHLKWKSITSSVWCSTLCPSICCGKEVGWHFALCILNWSLPVEQDVPNGYHRFLLFFLKYVLLLLVVT